VSDTNDITTEPPRLTESQLALLIGSCRVWDPELHGWVPGREASARLRWTEAEITRLRAELAQRTAERDALAAEVAALKAQPVSNSDELASIPLKSWVIEVFQHLCDSPHTPHSWKRDLDEKTQVLLDAIEQGKKGER
jgi:hypothetical protein